MHQVGILCADERETAPLIEAITGRTACEKARLTFYQGWIEGVPVIVLSCGVCKVNAAIAAQILIDSFGCNLILNAGTAGGMEPSLQIFDTVAATECAYWDVSDDILTQAHPHLDSVFFKTDERILSLLQQIAAHSCHKIVFGRMVTGESFIEKERRSEINASFHPLTVDMETASIAHVCFVNDVPFAAVRTVTDTASCSGTQIFQENCCKAAQISAGFVLELLRLLD